MEKIEIYKTSQESLVSEIKTKISSLFAGDSNTNYSLFYQLASNGKIYSKKIDAQFIYNFVKKNNLLQKERMFDECLGPCIDKINSSFKNSIQLFSTGLYKRDIDEEISKLILNSDSNIFLIGAGGCGKSACIMNAIKLLEERAIAYIALKLDTYVPTGTTKDYGTKLGLTESPIKCLDLFTTETSFVIIDQLDTLKWSNFKVKDCIETIKFLIDEIKNININRKNKIRLILACRDYDVKDTSLSFIFNKIDYNLVNILELSDKDLENILSKYKKYSISINLLECLKNPFCLYIWLKSPNTNYNNYTIHDFLEEWEKKIRNNAYSNGLNENDFFNLKNRIIDNYLENGKVGIETSECPEGKMIDYLISSGYLIKTDSKVMFVHQIILDDALVNDMVKKYNKNPNIIGIIGNFNSQNFKKRYLFLLFLQRIKNENNFITVCRKVLFSSKVRFSFKIAVLEVIYSIPNRKIKDYCDFYLELLKEKNWHDYVLALCVNRNVTFFSYIVKNEILENLFKNDYNLYIDIISEKFDNISDDIYNKLLESMICNDFDKDIHIYNLLPFDATMETNSAFKLRMKLYNIYPNLMKNFYVHTKSYIQSNYRRYVDFLSLFLKCKDNNTLIYADDLEINDEIYNYIDAKYTIDNLFKYIPEKYTLIHYYNWRSNANHCSFERIAFELIRESFAIIINDDLSYFKSKLSIYYKSCNSLFNEIILYSFLKSNNSEYVFKSLIDNINYLCFERTSGKSNKLGLCKLVVQKHYSNVSSSLFSKFEEKVYSFCDKDIKQLYKERKDDRTKGYGWDRHLFGEFQREIFSILPDDNLSKKSKDLYSIVSKEKFSMYEIINSSGSVKSPVSGKILSFKSWKAIILNDKIQVSAKFKWNDKTKCYIETSINEFSLSIESAVLKYPNEFVNLILNYNIDTKYIDAILRTAIKTKEIRFDLIIKVLEKIDFDANFFVIEDVISKIPLEYLDNKTLFNKSITFLNDAYKTYNRPNECKYSLINIMNFVINNNIGIASKIISKLIEADSSIFLDVEGIVKTMISSNDLYLSFIGANILYAKFLIENNVSNFNLLLKVMINNPYVLGLTNDCYKSIYKFINGNWEKYFYFFKKFKLVNDELVDSKYFSLLFEAFKTDSKFFKIVEKNINVSPCIEIDFIIIYFDVDRKLMTKLLKKAFKLDSKQEQIFCNIAIKKAEIFNSNKKIIRFLIKNMNDDSFIKLIKYDLNDIQNILSDEIVELLIKRFKRIKKEIDFYDDDFLKLLVDFYSYFASNEKKRKIILDSLDKIFKKNFRLGIDLSNKIAYSK